MKPKILLFTSMYDFSSDIIAVELEKRSIPYFRLNKEHLSSFSLSIDIMKQVLHLSWENIKVEIDSSLKSIYFRQPVFLRNTPAKPLTINQQLSISQWSAFGRALSIFENAKWMNWPQATYLAECKPYQLQAAKELGFKIPDTKITNDSNVTVNLSKDFIIKSLDTAIFRDKENCLFTYTTVLSKDEFIKSDSKDAPMIIQENISPKCDIRVTVVEDDVFAVKILSNGDCINGDWRVTKREKLEYLDFKLPEDIKNLCVRLVKSLGLSFGAIDLLESSEEFVFLEINPTGEWAWLNAQERNIANSIVNSLNK